MDNSGERVHSAVTTALVVVSVIFPILSAIAIYFRLYARRGTPPPVRSDDVWLFISWVCYDTELLKDVQIRLTIYIMKFTSLSLSILVWIYAARSGIDYYKVDAVSGTQDSTAVRESLLISCCRFCSMT